MRDNILMVTTEQLKDEIIIAHKEQEKLLNDRIKNLQELIDIQDKLIKEYKSIYKSIIDKIIKNRK